LPEHLRIAVLNKKGLRIDEPSSTMGRFDRIE